MNAFRFSNHMQRKIRSSPRTFLGESDDMKTSDKEENCSSAKSASLPLHRAATISYLEWTAEPSSDRMPDMQQLHRTFSRKHHPYDGSVKDYVFLYDDDPPGESTFAHICCNQSDGVKIKQNRRFARCAVFDELEGALQSALDSHQGTEDPRTFKMRHFTTVMKEQM